MLIFYRAKNKVPIIIIIIIILSCFNRDQDTPFQPTCMGKQTCLPSSFLKATMISQTDVIMAFTILLGSLPISPVFTAEVGITYPQPYTETVYLKVSNI